MTTHKLAAKLAATAIALAAALVVSGCSPGVDYSPLLPAGHDLPPPHADTTLDPLQVQQATEALITERNHLSAEAQGPQQAAPTGSTPAATTARPAAAPTAVRTTGDSQSVAAGPAPAAGGETK